jgi:sugar lactone lactonase YvrE
VTNTLRGIGSGTTDEGDVVRITLSQSESAAPKVTGQTVIASGFPERPSAAAFVQGPTGLALGSSGTLYVADTVGNRIAAVPDALTRATSAGTGLTVSHDGQLANPLGLALAPDGDLLAANAINGKIVEITPAGRQVGEYYADDSVGQEPAGNGDLFDVAISRDGTGVLFVNDGTNTLELLH